MDGSNNEGGNGPREMSRAGYARNIRAAMDERHQRVMANRQQFEPQVHEQITRLFQDYEAPLYARLRGFGRTQTLTLAETTVLSLVAVNGRPLEDSETQALTEHFLSSVHNLLVWKWTMTGIAAYMTYRGRRTFRFPFFNPEFKRFSPLGGAFPIPYMWHAARFAAYYASLWVIGEPIFQGANFMRQRASMERDPRIRSLLHNGRAQGATLLGGSPEANSQMRDTWESAAQAESRQQSTAESGDQASPDHSAWTNYRSAPSPPPPSSSSSLPQQQQHHQHSSNRWDSPDDFDDASPVAPSATTQSQTTYGGGSAWDRIRQQSQYRPGQHDQKSWERPQSGGSWSNDVDAAGRQHSQASSPSSSDNYSYSTNEDKYAAKDQAQRDFDRLLEKERGGVDQDRTSWKKK